MDQVDPLQQDFSYDAWPSGEPYDWTSAGRGHSPWDSIDFHVDLGAGRLKKGRIGIDRYPADAVDVVMDLETMMAPMPGYEGPGMEWRELGGLPFADSSIESIISHHALEHIGEGFIPLMDECYRVLKPEAIFRIITPLFPSYTAVADPDHKRYFMQGTFGAFCGTPGETPQNCWLASFSVPYTSARFEQIDEDITPPVAPALQWTPEDAREMRVALRAKK